MARCKKEGSSLKDRYVCLTAFGGKGRKKTIASIGRRLAELIHSVLRDKSAYETRIWAGRREYLPKVKELKNSA
jgi:hypothetical protein